MAFVNLPPNFQDMFYSITDRIAKLETGPNQAMYTAESAQGSSAQASLEAAQALGQAQAANALGVQALAEANTALAQATYSIQTANAAAAQATSAQFVAGVAQTSANGKNTSNYFTSAPTAFQANRNGTTPIAGDLWFVVAAGTGYVNAQYIYNSSTGWGVAPITNTVIANLDAGKITAGTITGIAYNNGSGTFSVTPAGALTASSATITGHIVATSGTFTGTVFANSGTFTGTITSSNATITGGSLSVGGNFIVNTLGQLTATSANITGSITATSGSFTGSIYASGGTIGGFTIQSTYLSGSGGFTLYSNGTIDGGSGNTLFYGYVNVGGGSPTGDRFQVNGTSNFNGTLTGLDIRANGDLFAAGHSTTTNAPQAVVFQTGGRIARSTSSSKRYKHDIVDLLDIPEYDPRKLLSLPVRAFKYNENYLTPVDDRANILIPGFIAEEVNDVYPIACDYSEADGPESWNDRVILPAMLALIQDQETRLKILEGN